MACRAGEQSGSEDDDAPNTSRAPYLYELAVLMTDRKLAATAQTSAGEQPTGRCGIRGPGGQWYIGQDLEGHQWGPVERAGVWTRKEFAEAAFPALRPRCGAPAPHLSTSMSSSSPTWSRWRLLNPRIDMRRTSAFCV